MYVMDWKILYLHFMEMYQDVHEKVHITHCTTYGQPDFDFFEENIIVDQGLEHDDEHRYVSEEHCRQNIRLRQVEFRMEQ